MICEGSTRLGSELIATLPERILLPAISRGGVNWTSMGFQPLDEMLTSNCGQSNEGLNKRGINVPLKLGSDRGLQYPANLQSI
jgi:hypothetical protein